MYKLLHYNYITILDPFWESGKTKSCFFASLCRIGTMWNADRIIYRHRSAGIRASHHCYFSGWSVILGHRLKPVQYMHTIVKANYLFVECCNRFNSLSKLRCQPAVSDSVRISWLQHIERAPCRLLLNQSRRLASIPRGLTCCSNVVASL